MSNYTAMGELNGACTILAGSDLGLATADFSIAGNGTKTPTAIQTPVPLVVRFLITLTSGTCTLTADLNATGTYVSAAYTTGAISDTNQHVLTVVTTGANPYVCPKLTASGGCVIAEFGAEVLGKFPGSPNWSSWHDPRSAFNAFATFRQIATGGVFTLSSTD